MKALDLLAPPPWQIFSPYVSACGEFFSHHSLSLSPSLRRFRPIVSFGPVDTLSPYFLRCSNIFQLRHPFEEGSSICHPVRSLTQPVCFTSVIIDFDPVTPDRKLHKLSNDKRPVVKIKKHFSKFHMFERVTGTSRDFPLLRSHYYEDRDQRHDAFAIIVPRNCSGIIQFRHNFSLRLLQRRPIRCRWFHRASRSVEHAFLLISQSIGLIKIRRILLNV